jgi:hypothetical protein
MVLGQTPPPSLDPALRHAIEERKRTEGEAQKYAYNEWRRNVNYDANGKAKLDFTDTYEIIFLNGAPTKRHTQHDGRPLSEKQQKAEDRKPNQGESGLRFALPLDKLATSFIVTSEKNEECGDRPCAMFVAVPQSGEAQAAKDGTAFEIKLWVDRQDSVFARIEARVLSRGMRYEKDTVVVYEFKKVKDDAWLPSRFWFKGNVRSLMQDVPVEAEQVYSNYRKFQVETKLLPWPKYVSTFMPPANYTSAGRTQSP